MATQRSYQRLDESSRDQIHFIEEGFSNKNGDELGDAVEIEPVLSTHRESTQSRFLTQLCCFRISHGRNPKSVRRFVLLYSLTFLCAVIVAKRGTNTPKGYVYGAVASDVGICSDIGANVLRDGGNAVDSAVAVALCLGVVNGESSGIGGGGFMLVRNASGHSEVIDFRERAPAAAYAEMFRAFNTCLSTDSSVRQQCPSRLGGLASGVPGELKGLETAHRRFGHLNWTRLVLPSVDLARKGFRVSKHNAESILESESFARPLLHNLFHKNGRLLKEGDVMQRLALADTLEKVAINGAAVLYSGEIAKGIIDALKEDKHEGIMTLNDLADYEPIIRQPLQLKYQDYDILLAPSPASGSVLGAILNILHNYNFTGTHAGDLMWHRIIESFRFAYAQRTAIADPCCGLGCDNKTLCEEVSELQQLMLNLTQGKEWMHRITNRTHNDPKYYGAHYDMLDTPGTTHFSVIDGDGNAVAMTSTVNLYWGSKVMTKHGIIMNNEMDDFAIPGVINAFGVPPSPANYIAPGKRPLSSSAPTIAVKNETVRVVVGASGGTRITTATAQVLLNILSFGKNSQAAIDHPRLHDQLLPNWIEGEKKFSSEIKASLEARGHQWKQVTSNGVTQAIYIDDFGIMYPASDPRKGGRAAGI